MTNDLKILFLYFFVHLYVLFYEISVQILAYFLLGHLYFIIDLSGYEISSDSCIIFSQSLT